MAINDMKDNNLTLGTNKQIEELQKDIEFVNDTLIGISVDDPYVLARFLVGIGYSKQSEVTRCKDCVYRDTEGCSLVYWSGGELVSNVEDDDFCNGAKTKDGAA